MINVGITGNKGFIGSHLNNRIHLLNDINLISFERKFFNDTKSLNLFTSKCDIIVHLAALNRHHDEKTIYRTNVDLVKKLIESCISNNKCKHIIYASSSQENANSLYGKSKKEGRVLLENWAKKNNKIFTGLIIPNVFGPFCKPNYNSVTSTFSYQLINNIEPKIKVNNNLKLIYIDDLVKFIIKKIYSEVSESICVLQSSTEIYVSEILSILKNFKKIYINYGAIPELKNKFYLDLFNTFRSYINYRNHFPKKYIKHSDNRGTFVELMRTASGGQFSYSTTKPGVTRGNHYHTRKIERFSVIEGKARIELRKVDSDEILTFNLDGDNPSFVDMPIFYTHNITNIGEEKLFTCFWINEPYNERDPDTYYLNV